MSDQPSIQKHSVMKDDFGWDVPVEAVPVPSEGKVYPQGSALHNRNILHVKSMTAREEDILSSRALIQQGIVITTLLESCLVDDNVDVRDMLIGDRNALMVSVRITGYGTAYKADVSCPECGKKGNQDFDLSGLEIKRLSLDPIREGENIFLFTLPVTGKEVHFRFLRGADEEEMNLTAERRRKMMPDAKIDSLVTSRLEQLIVSIDGVSDRNKINAFVKDMPALDSRKLRTFIENNEPGIDMSVWMNCAQCNQESRVSLPIGAGFFWPSD